MTFAIVLGVTVLSYFECWQHGRVSPEVGTLVPTKVFNTLGVLIPEASGAETHNQGVLADELKLVPPKIQNAKTENYKYSIYSL